MLAATSAVWVTPAGGGAVTATFLPRGASLIMLHAYGGKLPAKYGDGAGPGASVRGTGTGRAWQYGSTRGSSNCHVAQ